MKFIRACITLSLLVFSIHAQAEQSPTAGKEKVTPLIQQVLPDVPGQKGMMLMVEFLPGQSAIPHKHPGSVFVYVLEGSVTSQLEGQKPVNYHQGQYWYESPNTGHLICKNLSNTKPAKLLVWQLIDDDAPALLPLSATNKE